MVRVPIGFERSFVDVRMAARTGKAVNDILDAAKRINAAPVAYGTTMVEIATDVQVLFVQVLNLN